MGIPTSLASAKRLAVYWDNYVEYLNSLDDRQPNIGQGADRPAQTTLYIQPFGQDFPGTLYIKTQGNSERWNSYSTQLAPYTKATLTESQNGIKMTGFRPAKLVIVTGRGAKQVKTARTTRRKYTTRGGTSGSLPFGSDGSNPEAEVFARLADLIAPSGDRTPTSVRVSHVEEKI